jgi:DNA-binding beta-propeller fold protein YncE
MLHEYIYVLQEGLVVVIADCGNSRLVLWRLRDGSMWKHIGTQDGPRAVATTRAQNAFVVTVAHRVQVLTLDGAVLSVLDPSTIAGVGQLGPSLYGLAVCPNTDDILVTDGDNNRIVVFARTAESGTVRILFVFDWSLPFEFTY